MKILALTAIRSEYDLMSTLYRRLHEDPDVDLRLLVSGAHLSPAQGMSVEAIRADGLAVLSEVETLLAADTPSARLKSASTLLAGSIDLVRAFAPDLILFAGDREEVLVAAMLGTFLGIPTLHFFAGDHAADGHIDNPLRHAASKLATAHFVSLPQHRERLLALGESPQRIHVIGSVALDKFASEPVIGRGALLREIGAGAHADAHPLAVFVFHPLEEERAVAADYVRNAIEALIGQGFHVCAGLPNTDPGSYGVRAAIEAFAGREEVTCYGNLPRRHFVNLLRCARLMVGNSSAGLLEAPSLPLAAINIGLRQRGRLAPESVIFCGGDDAAIRAAIAEATAPGFQARLATMSSPYGDGRSSQRAHELIKRLDFRALLRKPEDPLSMRE